jgi:hypothetical protein
MDGWSDVGQFVVGVALVGIEWPTVTAVVMVIMNVTKVTDGQTVQTEGQLNAVSIKRRFV